MGKQFTYQQDGVPVHTRAEHRTGGPGVLSCRTGRVFYFCPVLPPTRTKVGSRTGQNRTKKIVLCSSPVEKQFSGANLIINERQSNLKPEQLDNARARQVRAFSSTSMSTSTEPLSTSMSTSTDPLSTSIDSLCTSTSTSTNTIV